MNLDFIPKAVLAATLLILHSNLFPEPIFNLREAYAQSDPRIVRIGASQGPSSLGNPYTAVGPPLRALHGLQFLIR